MTSVVQDVGGRVTKQDDGAAWGAGRTTNVYTYDTDTAALTKATLGYMVDTASRLSKHTLDYDRMGRVTKHQFGSDTAGNVHRLKWEYSYDNSNAGRLTRISSSNDDGLAAGSTQYAYESHGVHYAEIWPRLQSYDDTTIPSLIAESSRISTDDFCGTQDWVPAKHEECRKTGQLAEVMAAGSCGLKEVVLTWTMIRTIEFRDAHAASRVRAASL
jgi:hypothetical protein